MGWTFGQTTSSLEFKLEIRLGDAVTEELKRLIDAAKGVRPTEKEREEQRRSFAYGNTAFENARITRAMIDEQAEKLARRRRDGRQ